MKSLFIFLTICTSPTICKSPAVEAQKHLTKVECNKLLRAKQAEPHQSVCLKEAKR